MRRSAGWLVLAGLVAWGPAEAGAQEAETAPGPTVKLTAPQTPPGEETFVTIMLERAPSSLQTLKSEIEFDRRHMEYVTARKAIAAELAAAEMKVDVQEVEAGSGAAGQPAGKRTRIVLTVTGKKPIPDGPVAELRFKVSPGQEGVNVKLDHRVEGLAADGSTIDAFIAQPGEVRVTSAEKPKVPLVFACYFYMH